MKFVKNNKGTIITVGIFIVLVIILFQVKEIFFPKIGTVIYGDRLNGMEKVEIKEDRYNKIKKELIKDNVIELDCKRSGKIIKMFFTVKPETDLNVAKSYGVKVLEYFDEKEKKFYDFEIFISKEKESANFPIIGYKHHNKKDISWTKDR